MKSSTLSLVQWDFTSFLLGGFTAATIHSNNACAFSSWPAVPLYRVVVTLNDDWVNCHMVSPKFKSKSKFTQLILACHMVSTGWTGHAPNLWQFKVFSFFDGEIDGFLWPSLTFNPVEKSGFSPADSFPQMVLPAMAWYPLPIPMAQRLAGEPWYSC